METSLDVLSLAASMVETTGESGDAGPAAAGKDLPSRSLKADRLKDRQELFHVLHIDKEHAAAIAARKTVTASTQTQFSSLSGEAPPYPGPPAGSPPACFASGGDFHPDRYTPVHPLFVPGPPLPSVPHTSASTPTGAHLVDLSRSQGSSDVQNAPLNLSLSNSPVPLSTSAGAVQQSHRPCIITCESASSSPVSSGGSSPCTLRGLGANRNDSPQNSNHPVSDPAIEEHFRRSLGTSYGNSIPEAAAASTTTVQPNVSITGSVDDHFAKALGDSTWKAIKSQNSAHGVFTNSVDDHFAKALGATTWRKIKAEKEHCEQSTGGCPTIAVGSSNSHSPSSVSSSSPPPNSNSSLSARVAT